LRNRLDILVAESSGFSRRAVEVLQQIGDLTLADLDRRGLLAAIPRAEVLWVRLRHQIDVDVMDRAPRLKFIVSPTTGLNHIDLEEGKRRGIRILSLRGEVDFLKDVRATAELTVTLTLALLRHLPAAASHVLNGGWNRDLFKGRELYGKTVGVVGYGRLGRIVARYLNVFDTNILTADPAVDIESVEPGVTLVPFTQLLQKADLVTLHVNLCDDTYGFFGQEQFETMKKGAWFVNTSRGELIDETALLNSLQSGQLSGAALDVLCKENFDGIKDHPLVVYAHEHNNLIITPHIGGCTVESIEKTELFLAQKLCACWTEMDYGPAQTGHAGHCSSPRS
jgi:D-3-phosphoglycerate dehydrogenase / 2-oxoglutarate reductase